MSIHLRLCAAYVLLIPLLLLSSYYEVEGCKDGYYGAECDKVCPWTCGSNLCSRNGLCAECKSGYYGIRCDRACPTTCIQDECFRYNVTCTQGCKVGWYGKKCQHRCISCSGDCHRHTGKCLPSLVLFNESQCGQDSTLKGKCVAGCRGGNCDIPCPQNCLQCDRYKEVCTKCVHGKYGQLCIDLCPGSCYQDDVIGMETATTSQPKILDQNTAVAERTVIIIVVGVFAVLIMTMLVAVVIFRYRSKLCAQKDELQSPSNNAENKVLILMSLDSQTGQSDKNTKASIIKQTYKWGNARVS